MSKPVVLHGNGKAGGGLFGLQGGSDQGHLSLSLAEKKKTLNHSGCACYHTRKENISEIS